MHSISMVTHKGKTVNGEIPGDFSEFLTSHLLSFSKVLSTKFTHQQNASLALLYQFLNVPAAVFFKLKNSQVEPLLDLLSFTTSTPICFEHWLLPKIWVKSISTPLQMGPVGSLEDLTVLQFIDAQACLSDFHDSKDLEQLRELAAIIYDSFSPLRWCAWRLGLIKCLKRDYNRQRAELRIRKFKNVPEHVLMAIYFNFHGIQEYYKSHFPNIPLSDAKNTAGHGWVGLLYDLAGGQLGTVDQIESGNAYKTLFLFDKISLDAKKNK